MWLREETQSSCAFGHADSEQIYRMRRLVMSTCLVINNGLHDIICENGQATQYNLQNAQPGHCSKFNSRSLLK